MTTNYCILKSEKQNGFDVLQGYFDSEPIGSIFTN